MNELTTKIIYETENNELAIKDFDKVAVVIKTTIDNEYKVFELANKDDYQVAKEKRTELNKVAKEINDTKINFVKDLTQKAQEQTKAICDLLKGKALEYDKVVKTYEEVNGLKDNKPKKFATIEIKVYSKEELDKVLSYIPKKYDIKVKKEL